MKSRRVVRAASLAAALLLSPPGLRAAEVVLAPSADSTIYSGDATANSNGGGGAFSAGNNGLSEPRRGLVRFELGGIPADAEIIGASLRLTLARAAMGDTPRIVSLHRGLASWGENQASDAGTGNGSGFGAPAQPGDATWFTRFFLLGPDWAVPGGDFLPAPSASVSIPAAEGASFTWDGAGVLADAQAWHAAPAGNFGWIVRGDESIDRTNRQFHTRESALPTARPQLHVTYRLHRTVGIEREPAGGFRIRFRGEPGLTYTVEHAPDLEPGGWQFLAVATADAAGDYSVTDQPAPSVTTRFYRSVAP